MGEANRNGTKVVVSATNKTGKPVTGPYGAEAYCFDVNKITDRGADFAEEDGDVQPNGNVHFTLTLPDTCKTFALGVSVYFLTPTTRNGQARHFMAPTSAVVTPRTLAFDVCDATFARAFRGEELMSEPSTTFDQ